ncbi:MAG: cation:proton antiporter [Oscillospiraceae bacterium]|nr:cation:proton antiporter [Oscillospiraceae bacterium]
MDSNIILVFALILFATKFCGILTRRLHLPQVVGALLAGIILGPSVLGLAQPSETLTVIAELGVIVLLFSAGMEMDFKQFKALLRPSLLIAVLGISLAVGGGFLAAYVTGLPPFESFFIGVVIASTSTSITVEALQEMGKLKTKSGSALLSTAVIDDILGIILLSVVLGIGGGAENSEFSIFSAGIILLKIIAFFGFAFICGFIMNKLLSIIRNRSGESRRLSIFALAFCFLMAYLAEQFGLADIAGAFIAGVAFCNTRYVEYLEKNTHVLSYMFLSPVFFASIGINMVLDGFDSSMLLFAGLLLSAAVLSKLIGCGLGAKLCRFKNSECFQIGAGMVTRGEVSIIVASKGIAAGIMEAELFSGIIIAVIVTVLIAPVLLKLVFTDKFIKLADKTKTDLT